MTAEASTKEEIEPTVSRTAIVPENWPGTLAGAALFLVVGMGLILGEVPHEWRAPAWVDTLRGVFLSCALILPAIGYGIGWAKDFPRWTYPYTGMLLIISLYMMNVATPGLHILGYTFGRNDLWGWRAWTPFLLATGIGLLVRRSFKPVRVFFTNGVQDWTLFSFTMFGWLPLFLAFGFDEMERLLSFYCMIAATAIMTVSAVAYLRSHSQWQQAGALFFGILFTISGTQIASTLYWQEHGWVNVPGSIMIGAIVAAFMTAPAMVQILLALSKKSEKV